MKKVILSVVAASLVAVSASATDLYKPCVACHGAKAEKKGLGKSEVIAGWDAAKIVESLKGYKAGTLNKYGMGGVMKVQVAKLSDAQIDELAKYINTLK
ncbi:MAG: cytochrome c [Arcobacteraceae bacterium]